MEHNEIKAYIDGKIKQSFSNIPATPTQTALEAKAQKELQSKEKGVLKTTGYVEAYIEYENLIGRFYAEELRTEIENNASFYKSFLTSHKIIITINNSEETRINKDENEYHFYINVSDPWIFAKFAKNLLVGATDDEKEQIYHESATKNNEQQEKIDEKMETIYFAYLETPANLSRDNTIILLSKAQDFEALKRYLLGENVDDIVYSHIMTIQLKILKRNLRSIYPEIIQELSRDDYEILKELISKYLDEFKENSIHNPEIRAKIEAKTNLNSGDYAQVIATKVLKNLDPSLDLAKHLSNVKTIFKSQSALDRDLSFYHQMLSAKSCYDSSTKIITLDSLGTIEDVIGIIHETLHSYVKKHNQTKKCSLLLKEFPSIYYEQKAEEYLLELNLESKWRFIRMYSSLVNWLDIYYIFEMMALLEQGLLTYENIKSLTSLEGLIERETEMLGPISYFPPARINRLVHKDGHLAAEKMLGRLSYPIGLLLTKEAINKNLPPYKIKETSEHLSDYSFQDVLEKIANYELAPSLKVN